MAQKHDKNSYFWTPEAIQQLEAMPTYNLTDILLKMMRISGFTQAKLSEVSGIHINNIQSWMSGRRNPSYLNLIACINAMGFDLKFVEKSDEKTNS
jgi:transcriptional regulator with XRE-family HTH domain